MIENEKSREILCKLRQERGYSQKALAEALGLSSGVSISLIERGVRTLSVEMAMKLAETLKVSVHILATGDMADIDLPPFVNKPKKVGEINGLRLLVAKSHESCAALAGKAGIEAWEIASRMQKICPETRLANILPLANAFEVTVDDLLRYYPKSAVRAGDHYVRKTEATNPNNAIERYRREHNYSMQELANILGSVSRSGAFRICTKTAAARKYVLLICNHEGITETEFRLHYGESKGKTERT